MELANYGHYDRLLQLLQSFLFIDAPGRTRAAVRIRLCGVSDYCALGSGWSEKDGGVAAEASEIIMHENLRA